MDHSYFEFNRKGSSRWQSTVTKFLASERRLVQNAESGKGLSAAEAQQASRQIGQFLAAIRRQIRAFLKGRDQEKGNAIHGTGDLLAFADRAIEQHRRLDERLQRLNSRRKAPPLRDSSRRPNTPSGKADTSDAAVLAQVQGADRFVSRYSQGLRRILRFVAKNIPIPHTKPFEAAQRRKRVLEGYRQSQTRVQQARQAVRRIPAPKRSRRVDQALLRLNQKWQRVGRNFRMINTRFRKLFEIFKKLQDRKPPDDNGPPYSDIQSPFIGQDTPR
jgi:hypothetical protein